jgi:two-component system NtrC family sensor kinase
MADYIGHGKLVVRTELEDDKILVSFVDNGPGIPEDIVERIFHAFFTTKEIGKGTGLGLSMCRDIVQDHGGRIDVDSQVGRGSTFTVQIPVISGETVAVTEPDEDEFQFEAVEIGGSILVVDDEQRILDLLTDMLGLMGYRVSTAKNADQAMDKLDDDDYHLIFCDMKMPGFSGEGLYNLIKSKDPELAERVVFITGDTVNPETQNFLQNTGNPYISKPFGLEEIRQTMLKILSKDD